MRVKSDALSRVRSLLLILLCGVTPGFLFGGCTSESPATGCRTVLNCKDDAAPICDSASLACRACRTGDDVACANRSASTPRCGSTGRCVGCMTNTDCKDARTPRCNEASKCVGCQLASDCLSHVCNADGSCAPSSDVLFVDNKNGNCTGTTHSGDMSDPYCAIQDAVSAAVSGSKSLIAVTPSVVPYGPVSITAVGPAGLRLSSTTGAASSVQIRGSGVDAVSVTPMSGSKVVLSGFDISATGGNGINCAGGADLTVGTSRIHHNANGIVSSGCTLTLDRLQVYKSDYNGISLNSNTNYTLTNLMLWANSSSGISLSSSTGTMRFLTVYANGSPGLNQSPGISCGVTGTVENSIIFKNVSQSGFNQQMGGCAAQNVVTDDTMAPSGATMKTSIEFENATGADPNIYDLSLKNSATNTDCCIDKVQQGAGLPDHDFKGTARPKGAAFDIGADEVR